MKALVVGGTGPSGPFLVNGLIERGYEVTIFHRGTHEIPEIPAGIEHIHGDPHFTETISEAVGKRTFDVVIATYGRIRFIAEALEGKTVIPRNRWRTELRGYFHPSINFPPGLPTPTPEDAPLVASEEEHRFSSSHQDDRRRGSTLSSARYRVPLSIRLRALSAGSTRMVDNSTYPGPPPVHSVARQRNDADDARLRG